VIGITCATLTWLFAGIIYLHGFLQSMNLRVRNPAAPLKDSAGTITEIRTVRERYSTKYI